MPGFATFFGLTLDFIEGPLQQFLLLAPGAPPHGPDVEQRKNDRAKRKNEAKRPINEETRSLQIGFEQRLAPNQHARGNREAKRPEPPSQCIRGIHWFHPKPGAHFAQVQNAPGNYHFALPRNTETLGESKVNRGGKTHYYPMGFRPTIRLPGHRIVCYRHYMNSARQQNSALPAPGAELTTR